MRQVAVFGILVFALVACGTSAQVPTPLPTAVPPDGDATGNWAIGFRYEFPAGSFGEGRHRFRLLVHCPVVSAQDVNTDWHFFEISGQASLQSQPVYLRLAGLSFDPLAQDAPVTAALHPDQEVIAVMHWIDMARVSADLIAAQCEAMVFWDNAGRHSLNAGEPFQR
ncbi:hypothetical protein ACFLWA_08660 [Chloroflexota bacterium]